MDIRKVKKLIERVDSPRISINFFTFLISLFDSRTIKP